MKGKLIGIIIIVLSSVGINGLMAQDVLYGGYIQNNLKEKTPVSLQKVREADVLWSKTVWRIINLEEKINLPLYYPINDIGDRKSLISVLINGIKNHGLSAYQEGINSANEFASTITFNEIKAKFDAVDQIVSVEDVDNPGNYIDRKLEGEMHLDEVKELMIKEVWFFDKQRSVLEVRIVGLCPIRHYSKEGDEDEPMVLKKKLFWVYYPEARTLLNSYHAFNPYSDKQSGSFDELFRLRKFSSYIAQESNIYDNRPISEYSVGINALLESEKVNTNIFNYEQNLWEY